MSIKNQRKVFNNRERWSLVDIIKIIPLGSVSLPSGVALLDDIKSRFVRYFLPVMFGWH